MQGGYPRYEYFHLQRVAIFWKLQVFPIQSKLGNHAADLARPTLSPVTDSSDVDSPDDVDPVDAEPADDSPDEESATDEVARSLGFVRPSF